MNSKDCAGCQGTGVYTDKRGTMRCVVCGGSGTWTEEVPTLHGFFRVDEGAVYHVTSAFGEVRAEAMRTNTVYRSDATTVALTGKLRMQSAAPLSRMPMRVMGHRAILILDTGEGLIRMAGVWCPR